MELEIDFPTDEFEENNSSDDDDIHDANNEKRWRLSHLKNQFETLELHKYFNRYSERISHGYFSQFLSLQIILVFIHFVVLLVESTPSKVIPDLILYSTISIISIILLVLTDVYVKGHPKLLKIFATSAFCIVFFTNVFIPFYYHDDNYLRPAYTTYLIISNYIFLNVHNDLVSFVLGFFVSIFHIVTLILVTYRYSDKFYQRLGSDAIYLFCINGLGLYFRYMNEIVIRRSFLDRRSCIESTHQLKFEEDQQNQLLSSIIPEHIIDQVKTTILKQLNASEIKNVIKQPAKPFDDLHIQSHENVTILFADIVNYTAMTSQLDDIITLLETLNELFGRFDDASEEFNVLRIKFLGDCYYCVAGLPPNPAPNHAEACVDLGLKMIAIIKDVRERKKLDIDMRIGIHSGTLNSGIIGHIKWQYDIWSTDVDLANKMETKGSPGMVHITKRTRQLLEKPYNIFSSSELVNGEETFLIKPKADHEELETSESLNDLPELFSNSRRPTIYKKRTIPEVNRFSNGNRRTTPASIRSRDSLNDQLGEPRSSRRSSGNMHFPGSSRRSSIYARASMERRITHGDGKRRTAFMNNNIKRYKERIEETNQELKVTIENMHLSKFEQWFKIDDMNRILLTFKNWKSEWNFISMPDPLFKYYLLSEILLVIVVYIIENLTLPSWESPPWPFYLTFSIIVFILLPLSWTHHLWTKYTSHTKVLPKNRILKFLSKSSKFITNNAFARTGIYTCVYILFGLCVLTEWIECSNFNTPSKTFDIRKIRSFVAVVFEKSVSTEIKCIVPWHMTETCALAIIMSFLFLRMYMWLKLLYASILASVYSYCVWKYSDGFFKDSQTFNILVRPQISHIISVIFLTLTLHLVDRQTEYMHRLDHLWYEALITKQKEASVIHKVNQKLLKNILPIHVAEEYLNVNRRASDIPYHEYYDDAAVMFASITNFNVEDMGPKFFDVMNMTICAFDALSIGNNFGKPIEKIKIAKWTYMAACGLVPGLGNIENIRRDPGNHAVIALVKFAAALMKRLRLVNHETSQDMKLRIGISFGPIAAGVVGSKKPLYDIWGDPVNMASRMDTTGMNDKIQVLKPIAEIIEEYGYKCEFRGEVFVKGRANLVQTFFVALDEDFNLVRNTVL